MKISAGAIIVGGSAFAAILAGLAFHDVRADFVEHQHYFVYIPASSEPPASDGDSRSRELLQEVERRGMMPQFITSLRKNSKAVGGFYAEREELPKSFYWVYLLFVIAFWALPVIAIAGAARVLSRRVVQAS